MAKRRLIDERYIATSDGAPYTVNEDGTCTTWDGWSVAHRWERVCREFVASFPPDVDLSDVAHLCSGMLSNEIARRIVLDRRHEEGRAELPRTPATHPSPGRPGREE